MKPDVTLDDMIEILVKYLILEGCTPELRTHFLERKVRTLDVEEFQELGVAFQAAHGRAKRVDFSADHKKFGSASYEDDTSTILAWKVEVKREAAEIGKITKMPLNVEGEQKTREGGAVANRLRRRTSDQTVLGSNPAVAAALSPWTRLFTPIVPRRSLHISFY